MSIETSLKWKDKIKYAPISSFVAFKIWGKLETLIRQIVGKCKAKNLNGFIIMTYKKS